MTYQLFDEIAANTQRLADFRRMETALQLIWGQADAYLNLAVAEDLRSQARNATLHTLAAGHWPQIDEASQVARIMITGRRCGLVNESFPP